MTNFEIQPPVEIPELDQLMDLREVMVDTVQGLGKGVRHARLGERANTQLGTEYLLPGQHFEWTEPDDKFRTKIDRLRCYSASFKPSLGGAAGRLLMLESDSKLTGESSYSTLRNMFIFSWSDNQVDEARVLPVEVYSDSSVDGYVLPVELFGGKGILALDQEATAQANDEQYMRFINPLNESPWSSVTPSDVDQLAQRLDSYSHDLLAS